MMIRFSVDPTVQKRQVLGTQGLFLRPGLTKIRFGNRVVQGVVQFAASNRQGVKVVKTADEGPLLRISSQLQKALRLPVEGNIHLAPDGETWRLGPCLGIYVTRERNEQRMFGEQTRMLEELTQYGNERGIDVVVLTPGFVGDERGWRFDPRTGKWELSQTTVPDIILRRSGRFHEPATKVNADLRAFQQAGRLHSLPRNSSNKWTFYRVMEENAKLRRYVPATMKVASWQQLKIALARLKDAYLKPINGAQGICIHRLYLETPKVIRVLKEERVVPREADRLSTHFQPETKVVTDRLQSNAEIEAFWKSIQGQFRQWVLQESVSLLHTRDDRPVDFRWLVQYTDAPLVVGRVARVGLPGAITTNIHTGGQAMQARTALERLPDIDVKQILADMDNLALSVFEQLRDAFGPFAEVGIDIGVDESGRVLAFEVNPTPGRRMLRSLPDNVRELSLLTLVEYAIRAAGFGNGK
ncbi:YheC/YheD family protein [Alicyclobacillus ferrooxydans]|uniref:ATP-grasp domain-containing protein n=1 Tax=Alicyclobacillus ferrooxydans TaxID=471514 RepID=A0A0P9C4F3_9BACL|nr:YheC/YheD family protein [Alicyclobacillus ferrooxydans]KPV39860.1 hypothetical protein AN477_22510 [Alicyclobacillus ferrooxydans]